MMGDNRDNSQDSRVLSAVGYVPAENLIGKAQFIFFSTDGTARLDVTLTDEPPLAQAVVIITAVPAQERRVFERAYP